MRVTRWPLFTHTRAVPRAARVTDERSPSSPLAPSPLLLSSRGVTYFTWSPAQGGRCSDPSPAGRRRFASLSPGEWNYLFIYVPGRVLARLSRRRWKRRRWRRRGGQAKRLSSLVDARERAPRRGGRRRAGGRGRGVRGGGGWPRAPAAPPESGGREWGPAAAQ